MNLLSRERGVFCLPETGLFAHGRDLVDFRASVERDDLGWHVPWLNTRIKMANALGCTPEIYDRAGESHATVFEFVEDLIDRTGNDCIVEKTPENIFAFHQYLNLSPSHSVVVTSRDLVGVVQSLVRRGLNLAEALVAWFAHSYEIARLIENHPDQVLHSRYTDLTTRTDNVIHDIMQVIEDCRSNGDQPKVPAKQMRNGNGKAALSYNRMLEISGWTLADTSWARSASGAVKPIESTNMLGLALDVLVDTVAFKTRHHGLVRPAAIDAFLAGQTTTFSSFEGESLKAEIESASFWTKCLTDHYPIHRIRRAQ